MTEEVYQVALILVVGAVWLLALHRLVSHYTSDALMWYESTDHIGCIMNHRHLWEYASQFPELLQGGLGVAYITIYNCPVCVTDSSSFATARIDTEERYS